MDFLNLITKRQEILNDIARFQAIADSTKIEDDHAALLLQRCYRGLRCRHMIDEKRWGSREIQRVFRGHCGRIVANAAKYKKLSREAVSKLHFYASQIQKTFLGFFSRKYIHNVSDHKNFVKKLIETNNEARKRLNEHYDTLFDAEEKAAETAAEREFMQHACNIHHLISTSAIPGVYNHPFAGANTVLGVDAEDHIKSAVKDLLAQRRARETLSTKPCQVDSNVRDFKSIQSTAPYDVMRSARLHDEMMHKLSTIGPSLFHAGQTVKMSPYKRGISDGTAFVDPWNHPLMKRGTEGYCDMSSKDPFYSSVGGNKSTTRPNGLFDVIFNHSMTGGKKQPSVKTTTRQRRKLKPKRKINKDAELVIELPPIFISDEL